MKRVLVGLLGIMILLNIQLTCADEIPEDSHDINLYIFGEGGYSYYWPPSPSGNITTKAPNGTTDEIQGYNLTNNVSSSEILWWYSDPFYLNHSLMGAVHFTIWATCNESRNISFGLMIEKSKGEGESHGFGRITKGKIVHNKPIRFNMSISREVIEEHGTKYFDVGERIGFGVFIESKDEQPPAKVKLLYNSTNHPSHMKINTKSVSINVTNDISFNREANVDIEITDAFGVSDIADYDVRITSPTVKNITDFEVSENLSYEEGKIRLNLTWSELETGSYTIITTVLDNNGNNWKSVERIVFVYYEEDNDSSSNGLSLNFLALSSILVLLVGSFFIAYIRRKVKKEGV